ncbi:MAG: BlaI/MecI/CopY family transcriptional regulator [Chloroflexota bacterium]|nr:BlaI/MecI/CopY family transcriptional regulator [Chloroflexota bacterium]
MPDEQSYQAQQPEQLLGELEAAVMRVIWERGEVAVRAVQEVLHPTRPLAYTTVMTVMSRLARKGVLAARKQGKTYYYQATVSPAELAQQHAQREVHDLIATFGDVAIAQFLRALDDIDPERLAALRQLVNQELSDEM